MMVALFAHLGCYAQEDAHLKKLTDDLIALRKAKASKNVLNNAVIEWSASGSPKITLMDNIGRDPDNEYRGNGANLFKMNQVVTYVYSRQNTGMVSKGDFFNSTEKDIFYSAIEKTIKKGCIATYTLTGHIGKQEFIFMSFNPKTPFSVQVNSKEAEVLAQGVRSVALDPVTNNDTIVISIKNESSSNESFVILNHNPQK